MDMTIKVTLLLVGIIIGVIGTLWLQLMIQSSENMQKASIYYTQKDSTMDSLIWTEKKLEIIY